MQEPTSASPASSRCPEPPPLFSLLPPFAVLGFIGGWLTAGVFNVGNDNGLRWLLIGFTPLVAGGLGRFLSPRIRAAPFTTGLTVLGAILTAGAINGMLIGLFIEPPMGMLIGLIAGLVCSIPFVPALGAVVVVARRVGRARPGSIVDRADRRAVFCATLAVAAFALLVTPIGARGAGGVNVVLLFASVAFIWVFLAVDVGSLVRALALKKSLAAILAAAPGAPAPTARAQGATIVDFGLGDDEVEEVAHTGAVYRDHERTVRVFRGSPAQARSALGWAIVADVAVLLVGGVSLLIGVEHAFVALFVGPLFTPSPW